MIKLSEDRQIGPILTCDLKVDVATRFTLIGVKETKSCYAVGALRQRTRNMPEVLMSRAEYEPIDLCPRNCLSQSSQPSTSLIHYLNTKHLQPRLCKYQHINMSKSEPPVAFLNWQDIRDMRDLKDLTIGNVL